MPKMLMEIYDRKKRTEAVIVFAPSPYSYSQACAGKLSEAFVKKGVKVSSKECHDRKANTLTQSQALCLHLHLPSPESFSNEMRSTQRTT